MKFEQSIKYAIFIILLLLLKNYYLMDMTLMGPFNNTDRLPPITRLGENKIFTNNKNNIIFSEISNIYDIIIKSFRLDLEINNLIITKKKILRQCNFENTDQYTNILNNYMNMPYYKKNIILLTDIHNKKVYDVALVKII